VHSNSKDIEYLKSLKVLYVEDEEDSREQLSEFLTRHVGKVIEAHNGADGVAAYHEHHPDIILTDIQMPIQDGLSMAGEIRTSDGSVPIIVLTAFGNNDNLVQAINIGIDKYVGKPVNAFQLLEALLACSNILRMEVAQKQTRQILLDERQLASDIIDEIRENMDYNLDTLLAALVDVLSAKLPLQLTAKGCIRLFNANGRLITVSRLGIEPLWINPTSDDVFAMVPEESPDGAFIVPIVTGEHALVLPLTNENTLSGQIIILLHHDCVTSAISIEFLTTLARKLSRLLTLCLNEAILELREVQIEEAHTEILKRLETASKYRDNETGMHVMRMANIAVIIAKCMGLPKNLQEQLLIVAPLHDVGKIGIPDSILLKSGKLTTEEFYIMKSHTEMGERLLLGDDPVFVAARQIALYHHENWDGSGYPHSLQKEEIPVLARICAVADVFDALTSSRPYKEAWTVEEAVDWIRGESGRKFDAETVIALESRLPEILRIRELYRDEVIDPKKSLNLVETVDTTTSWVRWDVSLSVGIDVIDEHHRYLFELVNNLIDVLADNREVKELVYALKSLENYVQIHFNAEERMMEYYGYDAIDHQIKQHRQFQNKLKGFFLEMYSNPITVKNEIVTYLLNWLVAHISREDTRLKKLVENEFCSGKS